jgi:hypothetical protein
MTEKEFDELKYDTEQRWEDFIKFTYIGNHNSSSKQLQLHFFLKDR